MFKRTIVFLNISPNECTISTSNRSIVLPSMSIHTCYWILGWFGSHKRPRLLIRYSGCDLMYGDCRPHSNGHWTTIILEWRSWVLAEENPSPVSSAMFSLQHSTMSSYVKWGFWVSLTMKTTFPVHREYLFKQPCIAYWIPSWLGW